MSKEPEPTREELAERAAKAFLRGIITEQEYNDRLTKGSKTFDGLGFSKEYADELVMRLANKPNFR